MRVFILGLDGLDHDLTVKWNIGNLLQRYHGTFSVEDINVLYTPLIWSSILCGTNVTKEGYDYNEAIRRSMGIAGSLRKIRVILGRGIARRITRRVLIKLGVIKANFIMPKNLINRTFIEIARRQGLRVKAIEVPGYNERINGIFRIKMHDIAPRGDLRISAKFLEQVKLESRRRIIETINYLGKYDLIMTYIPLPDLAHHLYCGRKLLTKVKMYTIYKWLEETLINLLEKAREKDYATLILSDHGFKISECTHSPLAFWSLNIHPEVHVRSYKDIKPLVLSLLKS